MLYFSIKIHIYNKIKIGPHLGVNAAQTDVAKKKLQREVRLNSYLYVQIKYIYLTSNHVIVHTI